MDWWVDGWMDELVDGCVEGWTDELDELDGWTDGRMNWTDRRTDGWMDGCMDWWMQ
jgi:hypothetical protein